MNTDDDLTYSQPTPLVKIASGFLAVSSGFQVLLAAQTWGIARISGVMGAFPYVFAVLGLVGLGIASQSVRFRAWAVMSGTAIAALSMLLSGAWLVFSLMHMLVSLIALGLPAAWLATGLLLALSVRGALRADEARERLAREGLSLGV